MDHIKPIITVIDFGMNTNAKLHQVGIILVISDVFECFLKNNARSANTHYPSAQ